MKLRTAAAALAAVCAQFLSAADYVVCDFEDCAVGQKFKVWNNFGDSQASTATVETDPDNPGNKVLHVVNKGWNDHVEFELPPNMPAWRSATRWSDSP